MYGVGEGKISYYERNKGRSVKKTEVHVSTLRIKISLYITKPRTKKIHLNMTCKKRSIIKKGISNKLRSIIFGSRKERTRMDDVL